MREIRLYLYLVNGNHMDDGKFKTIPCLSKVANAMKWKKKRTEETDVGRRYKFGMTDLPIL